MRAPGVVEADPVSNEAGRVLDAFEAVAVTALLLERADRALDHADLLRAVRGDDLLAPVVAAHEGGEVPAREDQAVVRPQEELPVDAAERAEPSDQGMFQSGAGRSGLA